MAKAINTMKKQELVDYIVSSTGDYLMKEEWDSAQLAHEVGLKEKLKKELITIAERIYAQSLEQEEPAEVPVEETVLNTESAQYFHMHFQANFQKKLQDGKETPQDWGCAITFRKLDDGKWVCHKSSTRNLQWMTKPKVVYAGKYEKGVERKVISVTERDIKMLKYWLTSGRYGKTMSQYFSNDELPNYDACEIGKPIYKDVREESSEIPF